MTLESCHHQPPAATSGPLQNPKITTFHTPMRIRTVRLWSGGEVNLLTSAPPRIREHVDNRHEVEEHFVGAHRIAPQSVEPVSQPVDAAAAIISHRPVTASTSLVGRGHAARPRTASANAPIMAS